MKLIFDNNLSHKLVSILEDLYPSSTHVMLEGLDESDDLIVWEFARNNGFTIVTKDSDYSDLSTIRGSPPKVIWLQIGNCRVQDIERIIRKSTSDILAFLNNPALDVIALD